MSNYSITMRNRTTGEVVYVICQDDKFGKHIYGYLPGDCEDWLDQEELERMYAD